MQTVKPHSSQTLRTLWRGCAAAALMTASSLAAAQGYPNKPVRLVAPVFVGTPIDIVSRLVAAKIAIELGQPVVVENKPGGGGIVGAQEVLRQPADGYTLMTLYMPMTIGQTIYKNVPYDLRRDFVPVGQTVFSYNVLAVHPSVPANSVRELVTLLKARPNQFNFASGGAGTPAHIAGELFKLQTGTQATHVPYNQFPQAIGDLLSGQIQFMFAATPPVVAHIAAGKLRPLAVTGPQRVAALKDVPTMGEAGFPDFVVRDWQGIVAKAGTPKEVIAKVNAAIAKALATDDVKQVLANLGADPASGSPEDFGKLIASEVENWARVSKAANISVE